MQSYTVVPMFDVLFGLNNVPYRNDWVKWTFCLLFGTLLFDLSLLHLFN